MFKTRSIFQKVYQNTLLISCIPFVIITLVFCFFVYDKNEKDMFETKQTIANEYAQSIRTEIEKTFQKSDYILKSETIREIFSIQYTKNTDRLIMANELASYVELFDARYGLEELFVIYTSNQTMYEDKYISKIEKLENADEIWSGFEKSPTNMVWDEKIHKDELNNSYFVFYRQMVMEGKNILKCKVYIPNPPKTEKVYIRQGNEVQPKNNYIEAAINEYFVVQVERDFGVALRELFKTLFIFLSLFVFSLLLIFFFAKKLTVQMTQGIDDLVKKLSREDVLDISEGNFNEETEFEEIQIIKNTILNLLEEIEKISRSKQEIEIEKKDMEFSLLQKQLDPHTLYNSLSAIKYNAFIRKDTDTIDIVNNMTEYYRAVLNKGSDFISLRDELAALEKYVAINKVSRDINYILETSLSKELEDFTIIHFLLLPFVENSIIHGFDGTEDECKIRIDCKRIADFVMIKISDNGFGMTSEQISRLNSLESYDEGYGIKNSYRRMKLVYGEESSIFYESEPNEGTTVTLKFKYKF